MIISIAIGWVVFSHVPANLQPALSVGWLVSWLVGWSVCWFFYDFITLTSLLMSKWFGDLKHGPCPPTRDFGSRVSGLVHLEMTFFQSWGRIIKNLLKLHLTLGTCFSVVFSPI